MSDNNAANHAKADNPVLVWIDMEMSGLDPAKERILEIATVLTDYNLNLLAEGPELVLHQSDDLLTAMDEWNRKHHGDSGLIERVQHSSVDEAEAERRTLEFVSRYCDPKSAPLAGNSVHQDRLFLDRFMPRLESYLHYRIVDVSTIKELVKRWYPQIYREAPSKKKNHRALDDIRESIDELRYYREHAFR